MNYRPYEKKEDLYYQQVPLIMFIKRKNGNEVFLVTGFSDSGVFINNSIITFQQLFDDYEYFNGIPCGIPEEEEREK